MSDGESEPVEFVEIAWEAEAAVFSYLDLAIWRRFFTLMPLQDWSEPRFYWRPHRPQPAVPASATEKKGRLGFRV